MRGWLSSFRLSAEERRARQEVALPKTKDTVASFPIVVFSHSYCPLCRRVKQVLTEQGATFKAIELDEESDGSAIHSALMKWTGQAACPNVFIGGKHVGGYNVVMSRHREGKLVPLLVEAGAIAAAAPAPASAPAD
ncbi:glutaredoxin-C6-like isoform X1 [Ananas comosus]|uniref:Glutaredoxin-C6-like isoform X1 n=1 Tax=Ananas comosus TaxID=4615 RepID=A0A6P5EH82_ANACO|nr:glutaredoxin-C6-like isoform X1 [Ananas comosus]